MTYKSFPTQKRNCEVFNNQNGISNQEVFNYLKRDIGDLANKLYYKHFSNTLKDQFLDGLKVLIQNRKPYDYRIDEESTPEATLFRVMIKPSFYTNMFNITLSFSINGCYPEGSSSFQPALKHLYDKYLDGSITFEDIAFFQKSYINVDEENGEWSYDEPLMLDSIDSKDTFNGFCEMLNKNYIHINRTSF